LTLAGVNYPVSVNIRAFWRALARHRMVRQPAIAASHGGCMREHLSGARVFVS